MSASLVSVDVPAQLRRRGEFIGPLIDAFRKALLFTAFFASPFLSSAQQETVMAQANALADSQLTAAYKQALSKFTPANQEMMRRAERAWIAFADSEKKLVTALQNENLVAEGFAPRVILGEVIIRRTHLFTFFAFNTVPTAQPPVLQTQDQALTKTYVDIMHRLNDRDQRLLKEAERAWIAYRDADSASMLTAYGNPTIRTAAAANLTSTREAQIADIIHSLKGNEVAITTKNTTHEVLSSLFQKDSPNPPNPQDAKAIAEFQDQAKTLLTTFLAKKDAPFFKKADVIKNVPNLPAEISEQVSKMAADCARLSRIPDSAKLLNSASNESAAIDLLASWSKFTQQLKTGNVDDAGSTIQKALSRKPKDIATDYLPLWQAAESWHDVYASDGPKFLEHIRKAKSFADIGKTSDAIKEYQAAYDIIDSAAIAEKIKKIRDQSLGL